MKEQPLALFHHPIRIPDPTPRDAARLGPPQPHLVRGLCRSALRLTPKTRRRAFASGGSLPEREAVLPGTRGRGLQPLRVVGSDAGTMLLRAAWRRAVLAVAAAVGPKPATPSRGLRLRGTLPIPLFAALPRIGLLSPPSGQSPRIFPSFPVPPRSPESLTLCLACTPQSFSGYTSERLIPLLHTPTPVPADLVPNPP